MTDSVFQFTDADSSSHMQLNGSCLRGYTFIATLVVGRIPFGFHGDEDTAVVLS